MKTFLISISFFLLSVTTLQANQDDVYLVNTIDVKSDLSKTLADTITNQICADLSKSIKQGTVHCPEDVKALLQAKQQLTALGSDLPDSAMTMQAMAMLKANRGISGTLSKIGSFAILQITLTDYKNSKVLARGSAKCDSDDPSKLLSQIPDILIKLLKDSKKKKQ